MLPLLALGAVAIGPTECPLGYIPAGSGTDTDADPLLYHPRFHLMPPSRKDRPTGMSTVLLIFIC